MAPASDVFVAPRVSLRGSLGLSLYRAENQDTFGLQPEIRVGYLLPLGRMSLWPRLGGGYRLSSGEIQVSTPAGSDSIDYTQHDLYVGASAAFLVHAAPHFFLGLAPFGEVVVFSEADAGAPPKPISFGLRLVLGGWW